MKRFSQHITVIGAVLALTITAGAGVAHAQDDNLNRPVVNALLEPDSISIGDHFRLRVKIEKDIMQVVGFPSFKDNKLGEGILILNEGPVDTLSGEGRRRTLIKEYLLTSFDTGLYDMGQFPVLYSDKNIIDTLFSTERLQLKVTTFPVDTLMSTVFDIKRPEEAPLLVSEFGGYVKWTILGVCFALGLVWLIARRIASMKGTKGEKTKSKPQEPPHVTAIRELESLHSQKLWQSNRQKQYYTTLTDILRKYLEGRYDIGAMEMTSDEIVDIMRTIELTDKSRKELYDILRTSDLVKFAKFIPDADDNEKLYYAAYYFVEETKETPEAEEEKNKPLEDPGYEK